MTDPDPPDEGQIAGHDPDDFHFPELDLEEKLHLQRQYASFGRERVEEWVKSNIAFPLRHRFDGVEQNVYFEAATTHYIEMVRPDND